MEEFVMIKNPNEDTKVKEPLLTKEGEFGIKRTANADEELEELLKKTDYFEDLLKEADGLIKSSHISLKESEREREAAESILEPTVNNGIMMTLGL